MKQGPKDAIRESENTVTKPCIRNMFGVRQASNAKETFLQPICCREKNLI